LTVLQFDSHFRNIFKNTYLNDHPYVGIKTLTNTVLRLMQAYLEKKAKNINSSFY